MKECRKVRFWMAGLLLLTCSCTTKLSDPYIPEDSYSPAQEEQILADFNALEGPEKDCGNKFLKDYQDSLYRYCDATHGGDNIGGGCDHVAYAWSISARLLELALQHCKKH